MTGVSVDVTSLVDLLLPPSSRLCALTFLSALQPCGMPSRVQLFLFFLFLSPCALSHWPWQAVQKPCAAQVLGRTLTTAGIESEWERNPHDDERKWRKKKRQEWHISFTRPSNDNDSTKATAIELCAYCDCTIQEHRDADAIGHSKLNFTLCACYLPVLV